jgi:hypothetical protein
MTDDLVTNIFVLIIWCLTGWWGYSLGEKKGFNPRWSAVAGFFFGLIGIAVIALRKPKK